MSHRKPPESVAIKRRNIAGCWPNECKCGLRMEFRYGPGATVQERAEGAYRACACGEKVTAKTVMRNRAGHSET